MDHASIEQTKASLAHGYTHTSRLVDAASILLFFVLETLLVWKVWPFARQHILLTTILSIAGYIAADFLSGFVHWLGDTWGHVTTPVFGRYFIRPFREHHVDQTAITRHDFVQTNGANCMATNIVLLPTLLILSGPLTSWSASFLIFVFALTLGIFGTNQFHKWAHLPTTLRPRIIRWFQSAKLILGPAHHSVHHVAPYATYYCITVGWLNPILSKIKFYRAAEYCITKITKAIPRESDAALTGGK